MKVLRGGDTRLVRNSDVVVGDLLLLDTGAGNCSSSGSGKTLWLV